MIFRQIRSKDDTGTLTYLIADENTKEAVVIDPNIEDMDRILYMADELGVRIEYIIDTHTHADHITAAGEIKNLTGAEVIMHLNTKDKWKVASEGDKFGIGDILRANASVEVDRYVQDGDIINAGSLEFKVLFTPGHTDNHISLLLQDMLFTGDLLLVGQAGRSDLPGGNPSEQYDSLFNKILMLPDDIKIFPGHDYEENEYSFLADEKMDNPFLQPRTKDEYIEFVRDFFPPFAEASREGKMTLQCGTKRVSTSDEPFENISPEDLAEMINNHEDLFLMDVREPFELMAFGAVPGVINIPTSEITGRLNEIPRNGRKVVVICQSGNRSFEVSHFLAKKGFSGILNLESGTSGWMQSRNPRVNELKFSGTRK